MELTNLQLVTMLSNEIEKKVKRIYKTNQHLKEFNGKEATFHIIVQSNNNIIEREQQGIIVWPFAIHDTLSKMVLTHLPTGAYVRKINNEKHGYNLVQKLIFEIGLEDLEKYNYTKLFDKMLAVVKEDRFD